VNYKNLSPSEFELIPKGEKINARILELDIRNDLKVFIFSETENTFSCLLSVNYTTVKLPKINGLYIEYQLFGEAGFDKNNFILIECRNNAYLNNYTEILKEILGIYDNGAAQLVDIIHKVISKWRHFLGEPKYGILVEDEIVGLIGELLFLRKLINSHFQNSIIIWKAEKGEEDFINSEKILEVKTSLKGKHEHIINGIDQLLVNPEKQKHILSILLSRSISESAISLPLLINECAILYSNDPKSNDEFYKKLKERGYDPRDEHLYYDFSYDYFRGCYYKVDNTFPKLTTHELNTPLNSRISKVRYTLDFEGLVCRDFLSTEIIEII
jgi:hypothetical protein